MKAALWLLAPIALTGCMTPTEGNGPVTYRCQDGKNITVFFGRNSARIVTPGSKPIVLPQKMTVSGFAYETPQNSIRGTRTEITYTQGRMVPQTCSVHRPMGG